MSAWHNFSPTTSIEFPKGSGDVADYTPAERRIMLEFKDAVKSGRVSREQAMAELRFIHAAKVLLNATVREGE